MKRRKTLLPKPLLHQRILFFAAAFYTLGILIGAECKAPAWLFMLSAGVFLCLGIFLNEGRNILSFALAAMLCCGVMGGCMAFSPQYPVIDLESKAMIVGKVNRISYKEDYCIYQLGSVEINGENIAGNVFLMSYTMDYLQDDIILAQATLEIPERALYSGDFDDFRFCRSRNVLFRAISASDARLDHAEGVISWIHAAGRWVSQRIEDLFPRHQALAKAFIIGDESEVTDLQREQLNLTGITHILSISGSHIAILAGLLHICFARLRIDRRIPFAVSQVIILLYTILTGWKVSMVRAAWMYEIVLWGKYLGKQRDPLTAMSAAYLGILASNPAQVYDVGLQLSFGAVYAMICLTGILEEKLRWIPGKTVRQTVCAGIAAALGTFPVTNDLTNYYWLPSLLANGLATLYSLLMIPLLLSVTVVYLLLGNSVRFLGNIGAWWIDLFQWFTEKCAEFQSFGIYLPDLLPVVVLLWYLCIFLCSDKMFWPKGYRRGIALCMAIILCGNLCLPSLHGNSIQMRCFPAQQVSVILTTEQGKYILLSGGGGEELQDCLLAEGVRPDICILAHKGKQAFALTEQLRQMKCETVIYADKTSARILEHKYGREDIYSLPEQVKLSPRMELHFLFAKQEYPLMAVLYIDGKAFCCFVFEFMENAAESVGGVPILYYNKGMESRLPEEVEHDVLIIATEKELLWRRGVVNLYQNGETMISLQTEDKYQMESKYAGFRIYQ